MGVPLAPTLAAVAQGDGHAVDALMPVVYDELRRVAARLLAGTGDRALLQPTALVHEAYLKLAGAEVLDWRSQTHLLAIAARAMHQILIDHGRGEARDKRGGAWRRVTLSDADGNEPDKTVDCAALDRALVQLRERDERAASVVVMRFLGGLDERAIAEVLGVSERTVRRDWIMARAWLHCELFDEAGG
jgi:RNA polymerase sigma factor (TIGR02999 family)